MNPNIFKIAALGSFLVLFAVALYVYRPTTTNLTRITVVGDSQTKISPDTAVITFSVITQGKQALDAQQQNARKSEAVKQAVESVTTGAVTEIKTSDYNLRPEQDYYSGKMPKILGYQVRNTVTVSISDVGRVGAIVDAAAGAGANSVESIRFIVGETSPAQGEALASAAKQAMAKAESVARSLNGRIVRIVQTIEGGVPPQMVDSEFNQVSNAMSNSAFGVAKRMIETPVQAGAETIRSQVVLIVEIETS
jgi:uncharacterized protein